MFVFQLIFKCLFIDIKYEIFFSFPGGKADSSDMDLAHTALREAFEEIGLASPDIDLWGYMEATPSWVSDQPFWHNSE